MKMKDNQMKNKKPLSLIVYSDKFIRAKTFEKLVFENDLVPHDIPFISLKTTKEKTSLFQKIIIHAKGIFEFIIGLITVASIILLSVFQGFSFWYFLIVPALLSLPVLILLVMRSIILYHHEMLQKAQPHIKKSYQEYLNQFKQ
jgi:hypothetical protein